MLPILASLATAAVPGILYYYFVRKFAGFQRNPGMLYLHSFAWGAIGAIAFAILINVLVSLLIAWLFGGDAVNQFDSLYFAPMTEEFTKAFIIIALFSGRRLQSTTDGIVYGGAVGLGFGTTENVFYFLVLSGEPGSWLSVVLLRTFFTTVMHAMATASFGALLGLSKLRAQPKRFLYPVIGIITALFIHFIWNFSVSYKDTSVTGFIFLIGSVIIFLAAFSFLLLKERSMIVDELRDERYRELFPERFLRVFSTGSGGLKGVDSQWKLLFEAAASKLAFRSIQLRCAAKKDKPYFQVEVDYYRKMVRALFEEENTDTSGAEVDERL